MPTPSKPSTDLSLKESHGRQQLQASITDYVAFLRRQPAVCGSAEQQQNLLNHISQGHDLIKLVASERLKITRELDQQKHEWMEVEKQMAAPIEEAMKPLKEAIDHYNREMLRIRAHQLAETANSPEGSAADDTHWLTPEVAVVALPKGVRMKWSYEIVDPNQVPNGYWVIDEKAIREAITAGNHDIPGVRIYEEAVTSFPR